MMKKRLLTAIMVAVMMVGNAMGENPKREMRSTWLTTVQNIDWPSSSSRGTTAQKQAAQKQELIAYLDNLEALNMTSTCLHVRSMGDAMYPSELAPWSSYISGTRGVDPGWDPLAFFVEEAHKRGIEAYVWLNPYRWSSSGYSWNTEKDMEWRNSGMLIAGTSTTSYITFNPALPETRKMIVDVIKEILNNYAIDGILFDDYFYPSGGTTEGTSAPDYADYKASGTTMSIGDWRRRNVNDMVADCYNAVKELRPDVRFGIGPAGVSTKSASKYGLPSLSSYGSSASDWQYAQIYSDPLAWMYEGTVDFISPQLYWETTHSTNGYAALTRWWSDVSETLNCHYYASQASYKITNTGWGVSEMEKQVNLNREYVKNNNCGSIYYNTVNFKSHMKSMAGTVYSTPALSPEITWKGGDNYGKVANLAYNDGTLTWDATVNGKAIIRYTVYAIPMSVTIDEAKSADGDGIAGKYLQKVVYGTSYTLAADKQTNHWYVVCVMDGYSKEHELTVVNYPEGESETVTLTSPVNGAKTTWETEFSWSSVENGTYCLEIASDAQMNNIIVAEKNLKTNSAVVDLSVVEDGKTCYWRVRTTQPNKLESVSEVASFVSPTREAGPVAELVSPANGANVEEECTFVWKNVAEAIDNYTLEVSATSDFATIKYSLDVKYNKRLNEVKAKVNASLMGKGTFFWRVVTKGSRILDAVSEAREFTVTKISVGVYEPGYSIMTDGENYNPVNDMSVESVWFRSIRDGYKNMSFESNGGFNRGMCVKGEYVYVSGRDDNSSGAKAYLRKYNIHTGEHIGDLALGDEASMGYYPCNDVIKDSEGNVCITNLSLNISSTPLVVMMVDLESGAVTKVAQISTSKSYRIDHVALWGDVKSGNFKVYAAIRESSVIMRWVFENGMQTKEESCTVKAFYSSSHFGTAPRVKMIDENSMFVDGGNQPMARYNFATGEMEGSFKENSDIEPVGKEGNGCTFFTLNDKNYVVYSNSDDQIINNASTGLTPWTFNVVSTDKNMSFASMELLWTLPKDGLGNVYSSTMQAPVDYAVIDESTVRVVMYVPGCGLCAYDIKDNSASGIVDANENALAIVVNKNNIAMNAVVDNVAVYDVTGAVVAQATGVAQLKINLNCGIYIVKATVNGVTYNKKVVVK